MTDTLFPELEPIEMPAAEPVEKLSAGRRLTLRQKGQIERGIHPVAGTSLDPDPERKCKNCAHRINPYGYPKCELVPITGGPATDCRAWWPACTKWEAKP